MKVVFGFESTVMVAHNVRGDPRQDEIGFVSLLSSAGIPGLFGRRRARDGWMYYMEHGSSRSVR
jgi:hypothetical protein